MLYKLQLEQCSYLVGTDTNYFLGVSPKLATEAAPCLHIISEYGSKTFCLSVCYTNVLGQRNQF